MSDMQQNPYGSPAGYVPAPFPAEGMPGSIAGPLKIVAVIYMVFGALTAIGSLFILAAGVISTRNDNTGAIFIYIVAVVVIAIGVLQVVLGYGLFTFQPWARTVAIVISALSLLSIPFGTVLGGFTLYYLLKNGAAQEYAMLAASHHGRV